MSWKRSWAGFLLGPRSDDITPDILGLSPVNKNDGGKHGAPFTRLPFAYGMGIFRETNKKTPATGIPVGTKPCCYLRPSTMMM